MSVQEEREQVLESIYIRLLEYGELDKFFDDGGYSSDGKKAARQHPVVQLVNCLESARAADEETQQHRDEFILKEKELSIKEQELALKEKEFKLKDDCAMVESANRDIDRRHEFKMELAKLAVTTGVSLITTAVWGALFTHELRATRKFELDGTEVSAAGRWLKNSFPKPKL